MSALYFAELHQHLLLAFWVSLQMLVGATVHKVQLLAVDGTLHVPMFVRKQIAQCAAYSLCLRDDGVLAVGQVGSAYPGWKHWCRTTLATLHQLTVVPL